MKKSMLTIGMLCAASAAWAATITDDFNRPDQDYTNDCSLIGVGWDQDVDANLWQLNGGKVYANPAVRPAVMYNTGLETVSGGGTNFTFSMEETPRLDTLWSGIVFNYQNPSNFYILRFKTTADDYQLLSSVDGSLGILNAGHASTNFIKNIAYVLTVTSDTAYDFDFSIAQGSTVLAAGNGVDVAGNFVGGYAGTYVDKTGGAPAKYDNFSLEVGPPPPPPAEVVDDFNRADTLPSNNTLLLGGSWDQSSGSPNKWFIDNNSMNLETHHNPALLYNTALETGTNFTLSVDVATKTNDVWVGVAFNYQDDGNFYYLRIKGGSDNYQLIGAVGGNQTAEVLVNLTASAMFATGTYYTVTIASDSPYDFDFTIVETGSSTVLNGTTNIVDGSSSFTGGYAGLYSPSAGGAKFDNFSLQGPPGATGYAGWAAGWGTDIGAETADPDGDGLLNIYEYGLGGDPTNAANQGTSPEFGMVNVGGTNWFGYVYPQLADPESGLSYFLETSTDLAIGTWSNVGYTVTGTNITGGDLDFVTNITDTVDSQKFIRLIIE